MDPDPRNDIAAGFATLRRIWLYWGVPLLIVVVFLFI
jgi:hypothetical protein